MKILFISVGNKVDYQCDCLFHGLNCLDDVILYTLNDYWYMYKGNSYEALLGQWGRGFTICNRIDCDKRHIHRLEEAIENIEAHFYDVVIYGSVFRYDVLLSHVLQNYKKEQIIFIDGEDLDFGVTYQKRMKGLLKQPIFHRAIRDKAFNYANKGLFFKRELREIDRKNFYPIAFAMPEENIITDVCTKEVYLATIIPGKKETYIYDNEEDYYHGYQVAYYGLTSKKSGWDCLRHYEIMANGCIPYFPDIAKCPSTTMYNFPKDIILETNRLYVKENLNRQLYTFYCKELLEYTREVLSTRKMAQYVLSFII